jgi:sigma-E factor negative regulatory protein RseC
MNTPTLCHQGTIKEITGNTLFVEIERRSACASCHAKSVCLSSDKKDEVITVNTNEPEIYNVGEKVQVNLKKSLGAKAVVLAYLCPFLALALGLFLTYFITKNELLSIGVGFAATALYFLFIKKIDNKLQKKFSFVVSKLNE